MATGFRSWMDNAGSTLVTDMTQFISQNLGYYDTGGVNGALTVSDAPAGRTFFYFAVAMGNNPTADGMRPGVSVTDNGDTVTISWAYSYNQGFGRYNLPVRIHWGFF